MALILVKMGVAERTIEVYALANRCPFVGNSRWFEDVVGKQIAAASETLTADRHDAAKECGMQLDLWETGSELLKEMSEPL